MSTKTLFTLATTIVLSFSSFVSIQAQDNPAETADRLSNELLAEEMEAAGFVLDVQEGFEEEWESEYYVSSEDSEEESLSIEPEDPEVLISLTETIETEEEDWVAEVEEEIVIVDEETYAYAEEAGLSDEADVMLWLDQEEIVYQELIEETNWQEEEETFDPGWQEIMDVWEMEDLEEVYEDEDLDMLEELYFAG